MPRDKQPTLYNEDGSETALPFRFAICSACEGHGTSSAYLGAFTSEEINEDPDFREDYFAGRYDRACDACGGSGKVKVVDERRTPKAQLRIFRKQQREDAEVDAIHRQELLMEGGWREEGWFGRG